MLSRRGGNHFAAYDETCRLSRLLSQRRALTSINYYQGHAAVLAIFDKVLAD